MRKPDGYDEAKSSSYNSKKLPVGAYEVEIINAAVRDEYGTEKLILQIDIASGDYKGYFKKNFDNQAKYPKPGQKLKWKGIFKQATSGRSVNFFKSLIKIIEDSNNFQFDFNEKKLKGKRLGMVFKNRVFTTDEGKEVTYIAADTPLTLDDLHAGNFDSPISKRSDQPPKDSAKASNADDDTVDDSIDDDDLPF